MKLYHLLYAFSLLILLTGCSELHNVPLYVNLSKKKPQIDNYKAKVTADLLPLCPPEFPFKDGWLGGDGDVSVSLDATTTLFLFSDTYVGSEKQKSREEPGLRMIANSAAIQSCINSDYSEMNYYWNRMHTRNPQAIFKPTNKKHKFWVADAFVLNKSLYVLLDEIVPKSNAAPDDIFNFTQVGYTIARISNPYDIPPQWDIEYAPFPDIGEQALQICCHAKYKTHIYFFINRNDEAILLIRKAIVDFDNPEKPFEYYSCNKTWETDIEPNDMNTVVDGFRCNTVKYHPDTKQWVMICDIWFMDNKIKMRTAKEITGPWSNDKVIYTIPETTPGNALYHKGNFCYLPRECIQNYDAKNKMLLLTYDINNADMSVVISNQFIYTPKVIQVSLEQQN